MELDKKVGKPIFDTPIYVSDYYKQRFNDGLKIEPFQPEFMNAIDSSRISILEFPVLMEFSISN